MGIIKCPSCSADVDDKMLFCPNCFGELKATNDSSKDKNASVSTDKVAEEKTEKNTELIVCPSCGEKSSKGMLFCPFCFNEFSSSENDSSSNEDEDIDPKLLVDEKYLKLETYKEGDNFSVYKACDKFDKNSVYSVREFSFSADKEEDITKKFDEIATDVLKSSHSSIAKLFDYFHRDNSLFFVYEFANGIPLTKFLNDFYKKTKLALPEGMLVLIAVKLLDMLEYLHKLDKPLYCVDIRPSSVIVSEDISELLYVNLGVSYIQDLIGIYKDIPDNSHDYFNSLKNPKRDLWCVGSVLYYLISNLDLQIFESREPAPIDSIRKDLSPAFCEILTKLLGSDRKSKYSSASEAKKDFLSKCKPRGINTYDFYYKLINFDPESVVWNMHWGNNSRTGSIGNNTSIPMKLAWSFPSSSKTSGFMTPFGKNIVASFNNGEIFVLNSSKGNCSWNCNMREKLNPVISDGKRIYSSSSFSPSVFCFDPESENPGVWRTNIDGMLMTSPFFGNNNILYQVSYNGVIYAISPDSGDILWQEPLNIMTISHPVFNDDCIFVAGLNGVLYSFGIEDKKVQWHYETGSNISFPCTLNNESVLITTTTGIIFNVDINTASLRWKLEADSPLCSSIKALPDTYIFITQQGIMYNVASDGSVRWKLKVGGQGEYFFSITNNKAYVFSPDARILVIDLFKAKLVDKNSVRMKIASEPVIYNGKLYFSVQDGTVFCYC